MTRSTNPTRQFQADTGRDGAGVRRFYLRRAAWYVLHGYPTTAVMFLSFAIKGTHR